MDKVCGNCRHYLDGCTPTIGFTGECPWLDTPEALKFTPKEIGTAYWEPVVDDPPVKEAPRGGFQGFGWGYDRENIHDIYAGGNPYRDYRLLGRDDIIYPGHIIEVDVDETIRLARDRVVGVMGLAQGHDIDSSYIPESGLLPTFPLVSGTDVWLPILTHGAITLYLGDIIVLSDEPGIGEIFRYDATGNDMNPMKNVGRISRGVQCEPGQRYTIAVVLI